jgi:hypothetical protein
MSLLSCPWRRQFCSHRNLGSAETCRDIFLPKGQHKRDTLCKTIIISVLYGCEMWSDTLMEKHSTWVLLRAGERSWGVTGECRKLRDEELYIFLFLQVIVGMKKCRTIGYVVHVEGMEVWGCSWAECRNTKRRTFTFWTSWYLRVVW